MSSRRQHSVHSHKALLSPVQTCEEGATPLCELNLFYVWKNQIEENYQLAEYYEAISNPLVRDSSVYVWVT